MRCFRFLGFRSTSSYLDRLQKAVKEKDKALLQKAINESVAAGKPELDSEITKARFALRSLTGDTRG